MSQQAVLILQAGAGGEPRRWALVGAVTTIGRAEDSDIRLEGREVSRRHAQIRHDGVQYLLVDLGSKNGTLVNGVRVDRATVLRDGDELRVAPDHCLRFMDAEATVPAADRPPRLTVDPVTRSVSVAGRLVEPPLAPGQFALIRLLAESPGRVFSRDEVVAACYPEADGGVSDLAIEGLVRRLKARLATADPAREHIEVVRGHGIRLLV